MSDNPKGVGQAGIKGGVLPSRGPKLSTGEFDELLGRKKEEKFKSNFKDPKMNALIDKEK